jgi:magnesium transporter
VVIGHTVRVVLDLNNAARRGDTDSIRSDLGRATVPEIVATLTRLEPAETGLVFRLLDRVRALQVFEELDPVDQQQVIDGLHEPQVTALLEALDPDDRVRLLDELPATVATRLVAALSQRERDLTTVLLGYPAESAARHMSPEYVSLRASMTVAEALEKIRRVGPEAETVYALPVIDDTRRLVGVVGLRRIVVGEPDRLVGDVMRTDVVSVTADDDREVAARLVRDAGLIALPVVDNEGRLIGVLTFDDAMEILEMETTEDLALQGGQRPVTKPYLTVSVRELASARGVWLLMLIIAATLTVNVLQLFEDQLAEVVVLALFIPLLTGTGGNAGAQASTAVIRAMAVDDIRFTDLPRIVWREARVGVLLGLLLGSAVSVPVALIWSTDVGLVVGLTLISVCTWATIAGSSLPLIVRQFGADPAVVSTPVITTVVDATALLIYFTWAIVILGI